MLVEKMSNMEGGDGEEERNEVVCVAVEKTYIFVCRASIFFELQLIFSLQITCTIRQCILSSSAYLIISIPSLSVRQLWPKDRHYILIITFISYETFES